jgi:hypothetical protein
MPEHQIRRIAASESILLIEEAFVDAVRLVDVLSVVPDHFHVLDVRKLPPSVKNHQFIDEACFQLGKKY